MVASESNNHYPFGNMHFLITISMSSCCTSFKMLTLFMLVAL